MSRLSNDSKGDIESMDNVQIFYCFHGCWTQWTFYRVGGGGLNLMNNCRNLPNSIYQVRNLIRAYVIKKSGFHGPE